MFHCVNSRTSVDDNLSALLSNSPLKARQPAKPPQHTLRGWRLMAYEVSWPSVVFSTFLLVFAHYIDVPDFENWHYNRHNEWSFDFKEAKKEIVPFQMVLVFGIVCAVLIAVVEMNSVRYVT